MASESPTSASDVIVIGGGLAGKAASLHLARSGLSVICIEPAQDTRQAVGESLDWSAPDLLKALGLPMEQLVSERIATWKRHVTLQLRDGCSEQYIPSDWLAHAPFRVELRTLHVDRQRLDEELASLATAQGVMIVRHKVVGVEREGSRILSVKTAGGSTFAAKWFIDSSGFARSLNSRLRTGAANPDESMNHLAAKVEPPAVLTERILLPSRSTPTTLWRTIMTPCAVARLANSSSSRCRSTCRVRSSTRKGAWASQSDGMYCSEHPSRSCKVT